MLLNNQELLNCRTCPRLVEFREAVARKKRKQYQDWDYWGKPVPGYGDPDATWMIVGLAPAAHGGNRTGRVFTGDKSATFLFQHLAKVGLSNLPDSVTRDDGLILNQGYMTAVLKCVPPKDRPQAQELKQCRPYFTQELENLPRLKLILALGRIAHNGILDYYRSITNIKKRNFPFTHGGEVQLPDGRRLISSYHPSPRNVNTGRLTSPMFLTILSRCKEVLC